MGKYRGGWPQVTSVQRVSLHSFLHLFLQGSLDHSEVQDSRDSCLLACQNNAECNWYSYNPTTQICLEFKDCVVDEALNSYISGQRGCEVTPTTTPLPTTTTPPPVIGRFMLIVTGLPAGPSMQAQVIDLIDQNTCNLDNAKYPISR